MPLCRSPLPSAEALVGARALTAVARLRFDAFVWRVIVVLALWAGLAQSASAQTAADVTWELLGRPLSGNAESLAFVNGAAQDGSLDTLYASSGFDLVRLPPGGEWSENIHLSASTNVNVLVTSQGTLLAGYTYLQRSTDHGRTWDFVEGLQSVDDLLQSTLPALDGAVFVGGDRGIFRSDDDGQTWARIGNVGSPTPPGALVEVLEEVPQSPMLPDGRLLAAVQNGLAYSDDGGVTWTLSNVWSPFRYWGGDFAVARDASHPFGGTVYASVRDFQGRHPAILRLGRRRSDVGAAPPLRRGRVRFDRPELGAARRRPGRLALGRRSRTRRVRQRRASSPSRSTAAARGQTPARGSTESPCSP